MLRFMVEIFIVLFVIWYVADVKGIDPRGANNIDDLLLLVLVGFGTVGVIAIYEYFRGWSKVR